MRELRWQEGVIGSSDMASRAHRHPRYADARMCAQLTAPLGVPNTGSHPATQVPRAIGAWAMVAMVAASVSTADGAILATATVAAHNLWRKVRLAVTRGKETREQTRKATRV